MEGLPTGGGEAAAKSQVWGRDGLRRPVSRGRHTRQEPPGPQES